MRFAWRFQLDAKRSEEREARAHCALFLPELHAEDSHDVTGRVPRAPSPTAARERRAA